MSQNQPAQDLNARGYCCICARNAQFIAAVSEWGSVRESMHCDQCWSSSRKRHVAREILNLFAPERASLVEAALQLRNIDIYSAVADENIHQTLGKDNPRFIVSEYFPGIEEGALKDGVVCQNLERLTYPHEQFDLVITEDIFEHIRKPYVAFREVNRVLKTGGYHIFTTPLYFDRKTVSRVDTSSPEDRALLPAAYHIDKLRQNILVYTDFGYDLFEELEKIGFHTTLSLSSYRDAVTLGIADSYVFTCRKIASC